MDDKKYLLAIDIGTSGCKVALFSIEGEIVGSKTGSYKTYYGENNKVEHKAEEWWESVCNCIKEIISENKIDTKKISGVGIDGQSWSCIPVDENGNVLRNVMIWLDRRAEKEAQYIKNTCGEERIINLCGNPVDASYITPKMLWIKNNERNIYDKTYKFLQSNAYIAFKLTDVMSQDYSQAYGFHFFDIKNGRFDRVIADEMGLSVDKIADLKLCSEIVGHITEKASLETGLMLGTPVVAGGLDAACCTLGAGVINKGETQEQGGQAGGMSIVVDKALIHPKLILSYHVVPDKWLLQGGTVGGGGTINWFNRELGEFEKIKAKELGCSSFEIISKEAEEIAPGSEGLIFLPYMAGERSPLWDSHAKGAYIGLGFNKTRQHMIRATMEGVAYSLKHNLITAEEVGSEVDIMVSVGGSANSNVWNQIKSDVTGKQIVVPYADSATTLGAAILAGIGVGVYESFEDAVKKTVKINKYFFPNLQNKEIYEKLFSIYKDLYKNLKDSFKKLS